MSTFHQTCAKLENKKQRVHKDCHLYNRVISAAVETLFKGGPIYISKPGISSHTTQRWEQHLSDAMDKAFKDMCCGSNATQNIAVIRVSEWSKGPMWST